jgi:hypothetical protein
MLMGSELSMRDADAVGDAVERELLSRDAEMYLSWGYRDVVNMEGNWIMRSETSWGMMQEKYGKRETGYKRELWKPMAHGAQVDEGILWWWWIGRTKEDEQWPAPRGKSSIRKSRGGVSGGHAPNNSIPK